ncbi:MAG: Ig-like domain-containing protein [Sporichthyaceae bacterium]|nr:Ig-like domain-containing protein [Sporichthyaceae bacterium]
MRATLASLLTSAGLLAGCGGGGDGGIIGPPPGAEPVATVVVTPAAVRVEPDEEVELAAETRAADGTVLTGRTITWASSDEEVATVAPTSGAATVVTGHAFGVATITATSEGRQATAGISVERLGFQLLVTPSVDTVVLGQTVQFQAEVRALDGTVLPETFTWSSKDQDPNRVVAEVDPATGVVTGLAPGEAVIIAAPASRDGTGSARVLVLGFFVVSAGLGHSCGVTIAGAAYCWGDNDHGQLGDGTTTDRIRPVPVAGPPGGLAFTTLRAGNHHTCGVTAGPVYCWGDNSIGQLGDGTTTDRTRPTPISPNLFSSGVFFASVHAGRSHTCGRTFGGGAYCWGSNVDGQLGSGTSAISSPVPVEVSVPPPLLLVTLSAGSSHNCAVASDARAYCWGDNASGELGDGTTVDRAVPVAVAPPAGQTTPLAFTTLGLGANHSCGRTAAGVIYCWGANASGQLGDGTTTGHRMPAQVLALVAFESVTAGLEHTCGLGPTGTARCWGDNLFGQLGDGSVSDRLLPTVVAGGLSFARLSAGSGHTCGVTLDGRPHCWGTNISGQLGTGTTELSRLPLPVVSP